MLARPPMANLRSAGDEPSGDPRSRAYEVLRLRAGQAVDGRDAVSVEEPLEIRVLGKPIAVVMRTPGDDLDLAAGFVVTEGIVSPDDLSMVAPCVGADGLAVENVVNAALVEGASLDVERFRRNLYTSSSCGVCGKATLDAIEVTAPAVKSDLQISAEVLLKLPAAARAAQSVFETTGGLHAAALFSAAGERRELREDVGRHNAVDKVIGARVRRGAWPLDQDVLFVSGRAGFEILQKARVAGIPIVASVGAPSSLAIECAQAGAMTLVGFLRDGGFNVYCGGERVRQ